MVTIREIADTYGVSKQAVFARVKKLPKDCYEVDDNGTYNINEKGQKTLEKALSKRFLKVDSKLQTKELLDKIATLQQEIDNKNTEIDRLITILDQEQKLHAIDKQKILLLEQKKEKKWWQFWKKEDPNNGIFPEN